MDLLKEYKVRWRDVRENDAEKRNGGEVRGIRNVEESGGVTWIKEENAKEK